VDYTAEVEAWRRQHELELTREDGWLAQVAVYVLAGKPLVLDVGMFIRDGNGVRFAAATDGATLRGEPCREAVLAAGDTVARGARRYQLVERAGSLRVRVRDADAPARASFHGLSWFPIDAAWRVDGTLADAPHEQPMHFTGGEQELARCPGTVSFSLAGATHQLTPYVRAGGELLFVFRDPTNADATCELCRYFETPAPVDGRVVLDFNKAAAPICAYVQAVTCVLPPPQNRLAIRIEAGEKRY
jgi:uncharacterized protein (DUF1684 family)